MALINITTAQRKRLNRRDTGATAADNALGSMLKVLADDHDVIHDAASVEHALVNVATIAEINAGKTLIPAITGKTITIVGYDLVVAGSFATGTDARLQDTNGTPVVVVTALTAALSDGAKIPGAATVANVTNGAGYGAALTAGKGLVIKSTGTAMTGGTSIKVIVRYLIA